jgi:hypothetical protein
MLSIQHWEPGTRLKLKDGKIVEVVDNPQDGTWLIVRDLSAEASQEFCHIDDILELAAAEQK